MSRRRCLPRFAQTSLASPKAAGGTGGERRAVSNAAGSSCSHWLAPRASTSRRRSQRRCRAPDRCPTTRAPCARRSSRPCTRSVRAAPRGACRSGRALRHRTARNGTCRRRPTPRRGTQPTPGRRTQAQHRGRSSAAPLPPALGVEDDKPDPSAGDLATSSVGDGRGHLRGTRSRQCEDSRAHQVRALQGARVMTGRLVPHCQWLR
jgi:hypothetical protein